MKIGNIPKEIRRKPSMRAYVLLGYLPTSRLEHISCLAVRRHCLINIYHACMKKIITPLIIPGQVGIPMSDGNGVMRRCHPLYSCFIGDYPEQCLVVGAYRGKCPGCPAENAEMGDLDTPERNFCPLHAILHALHTIDEEGDDTLYRRTCQDLNVKAIVDPFWKDLPYAHPYRSTTPDILHQLYQGVMKHIISWVVEACGAAEIDARCRRLPPNHNIHLFMKGISSLSHVTGREHSQMCQAILGLVIGIPLDGSQAHSANLVCALWAILDFLFLCRYPIHTNDTLQALEKSLKQFHEYKHVFIDLGIRQNFNKITKLHFIRHYVRLIRLFGTLDNFDTQYTERLHINLAKDAYDATNQKDEFPQMTVWLERQEKIARHQSYIDWHYLGCPSSQPKNWTPPGLDLNRYCQMTKRPSVNSVDIGHIETAYGATHFRAALARYIISTNNPTYSSQQIENHGGDVHLPMCSVSVWHRIKFIQQDHITGVYNTVDSIHVQPSRLDTKGHTIPGRFDTALVRLDGATLGPTGVNGILQLFLYILP